MPGLESARASCALDVVKQPEASGTPPHGIALSCASCSHQWTTVDEPDDTALVDVVADLFVPNTGMVSDRRLAESAFKAAETIGFSRGWKQTEIRQYADRVKRRVAVRLLALEERTRRQRAVITSTAAEVATSRRSRQAPTVCWTPSLRTRSRDVTSTSQGLACE